jgi:formylglycine-generating enzyme required for sulfatase activity
MLLPDTWINPKDGSLMRRIPAGEFLMGSTPEQIEAAIAMDKDGPLFALHHECPQFRAFVSDFYMAVYVVTNQQFARFLSDLRPSHVQLERWVSSLQRITPPQSSDESYGVHPGFERHPIAHVSWHGADAYCRWAGLHLPTEIEWEKAARGIDGRLFPWGNEWDSEALSWWSSHDADHDTAPVDAFANGCSPYGICQMAGNVEEWCADWYQNDAYQMYSTGDMTPPRSGLGHIVRGGNCMFRHKLGFRCAMRRSSASLLVNILYTGIRCSCGSDNPRQGKHAIISEGGGD